MATSKNEMVRYRIGTIETVLHHYLINLFLNGYVKDPGQSLINDNFTLVNVVKITFKECNSLKRCFLKDTGSCTGSS